MFSNKNPKTFMQIPKILNDFLKNFKWLSISFWRNCSRIAAAAFKPIWEKNTKTTISGRGQWVQWDHQSKQMFWKPYFHKVDVSGTLIFVESDFWKPYFKRANMKNPLFHKLGNDQTLIFVSQTLFLFFVASACHLRRTSVSTFFLLLVYGFGHIYIYIYVCIHIHTTVVK